MYSTLDLQKLVQMLSYLGIVGPGSYPAHSVVLGAGASAAPNVAGTILASNGPSADPSFQALAALGIAHSGANSDITSLSGLTTPLSVGQGGTGASTAASARSVLGAAARGANSDITSLTGLTGAIQTPSTISAGAVISSNGAGSGAQLQLIGNAGTFRNIQWQTGSANRWILTGNADAETGSNSGSNLSLLAYNDAGSSVLSVPLTVNRASGAVSVNQFGVLNSAPSGYAAVIGANPGIAVSNGMLGIAASSPGATDIANVVVQRSANYSGGTPGFVNAAVYVYGSVASAATSYEWPLLTVLENSATGGENSALYAQGNRMTSGTGPTWAATIEAREKVAINNPASGLIGLEVDNRSNGTDGNFQRIGIDIVCTRFNASGPATQCGYGVRLQNSGDSQASYIVGFGVAAPCAVGFDTSQATVSTAAVRMASGQAIAFDATSVNQFKFDGSGLNYQTSGTTKVRLNQDGSILMSGAHTLQVMPNVSAFSGSISTYLTVVVDGTTYHVPLYA
jgi:hypothetical protein